MGSTIPAGTAGVLVLPPPLVRILVFLGVAAGVLLALPHLPDPVWQDEAYMVMNFSDKGFLYPFTDYHLPNNHILFSSLLALWSEPGDPVAQMRLLPLLLFVASMGVLYAAVARLAGAPAAILALVLFATSHVTRDFAAQLRGYAPSWLPLSALLLVTPRWATQGGGAWGATYALAAAASVAILPSNFWFCLAFALWGCALGLADRAASGRQRAMRAAVLLWAPLAGFLAYAGVWLELLMSATRPWGGWPYGLTGSHWVRATLADHLWLLPLGVVGLLALVHRAWASPDREARSQLLFLAGLAAALSLMALVIPYPPFPRTFVPALPLAYAGLALLVAGAWNLPQLARHRAVAAGSFAAAVLVALLLSARSPACGGDPPASEFPQDLCHSFYHRQYRPDLVVGVLGERSRTQGLISIVTDDEGFWALSFLVRQGVDFPLEIVRQRLWLEEGRRRGAPRHPGLVVTRSRAVLEEMLAEAGLPPGRYRETDTGYFKIYASET